MPTTHATPSATRATTLDAGDEYTFTLVLDDPEPSREPSAQR